MSKIQLRRLCSNDEAQFIAASKRSRQLHKPWVSPPINHEQFANYLGRFSTPASFGFVVTEVDQFAGVINISNIVRGPFLNGYLSYFAFSGFESRGVMTKAIRTATRLAFGQLGLHRLEANIQPDNVASIALVKGCGFQLEGYSPRYLKIGGRWRDHERWALLAR
jgi:ribosomal-protein-alanine N-acetyltransferase